MGGNASPQVRAVLGDVLSGIRTALRNDALGVYLSGSLAAGGFDLHASDIDLVVILDADIRPGQLEVLRAMHAGLVVRAPEWEDRIEVLYVSHTTLREFLTKPGPLAVISPGEPLHVVQAGDEW